MKAQGKYVQLLERELEYLRDLLGQARKEIDFYRAKVERLELSLMSQAAAPAQQAYVARTEARPENVVSKIEKLPSGRMPFSEIKRRWNALNEKEQEQALKDGWNMDAEVKEESNAGS